LLPPPLRFRLIRAISDAAAASLSPLFSIISCHYADIFAPCHFFDAMFTSFDAA